jgi:small subunit ribosomal protein S1
MFEEELERKDEAVEENKPIEVVSEEKKIESTPVETEKKPEAQTGEYESTDNSTVENKPSSEAVYAELKESDDADDEGNEFIKSVMSEAISDVEGKPIKRGDIMDATIVKVSPDGLLVDVGQKSEGFIAVKEISRTNPELPLEEEFSPGDTVRCKVMKSGDSDGTLLLSKKRADFELIWDRLSEAMDRKEILSTTGKKAVKGGILVDLGVTAFIPRSLIEMKRNSDPKKWIGKEMRVRVIEVDRSTRRVVCSQRVVLEQEKSSRRDAFIENLEVGELYEGKVVSIVEFGAFVDLGEKVEGLIHLSELSWGSRKAPKDVLSKGDKVTVKLLKIAQGGERISLSLRQANPHPWELVPYKYQADDVVEGTVRKLLKFGAIVEIEEGISGLLHISQIAHHRVERVDSEISEGQTVKCKVIDIHPEERKMRLSMKALIDPPARTERKRRFRREQTEEEKYLQEFAREGGDPSVRFMSESDLEKENRDVLEAVKLQEEKEKEESEAKSALENVHTEDKPDSDNSSVTATFEPDSGKDENTEYTADDEDTEGKEE